MDQRRVVLWAVFVLSTLFSGYSLWPSGDGKATRQAEAPGTAASGDAAATAPTATAGAAAPAPALAADALDEWRSQLEASMRDPFFTYAEIAAMNRPAPVVAVVDDGPVLPPSLPDYTLKLTMRTGPVARALIGNQVVKVGDILGDERVVDIFPNAVVLERDGVRRQLQRAAGSAPAVDRISVERVR